MRKIGFVFCIIMMLALAAPFASAASFNLYEGYTKINGDALVDIAPFNVGSTKTITISSVSGDNEFVGIYLDYEIDEAVNTFYNEQGSVAGAPPAGLSWEIDEPGFVFGDIYANFAASDALPTGSKLDNKVFGGNASTIDDVAIALGWNFFLPAGETATVQFFVSSNQPRSGFYLTQLDPDSNARIYFSSDMTIGGNNNPVPEPSTIILMLSGLGLVVAARFKKSA
jgi:hypothetical protein